MSIEKSGASRIRSKSAAEPVQAPASPEATGVSQASKTAAARPAVSTQSTFTASRGSVPGAAPAREHSIEDDLLSREAFSTSKRGPDSAELSQSMQALAAKLAAFTKQDGR